MTGFQVSRLRFLFFGGWVISKRRLGMAPFSADPGLKGDSRRLNTKKK
jgi:hypothetical protein